MQVAAANVQRNVGRVDHTMQQCKEVWHNVFNLVGYKHLVAVQLNFVTMNVEVALDAWEVEYTGQVEGVVYIKVYPEERVVRHGVKFAVELLVVFVLECRWRFSPQRCGIVYDIVLFGVNLLAVFPFCLFAESNRYG